MTIRVSYQQRRLIDRLIKAGETGVQIVTNHSTADALVKNGYAEWEKNQANASPRLMITGKGLRFYRN